MENSNWQKRFQNIGALWRHSGSGPHVEYVISKKHSDFYFNTDMVISRPDLTNVICKDVFLTNCEKRSLKPDWVITCVSDVPSGLVLATTLSQMLQSRLGYFDMRTDTFGFPVREGETALLITDDIHRGTNISNTAEVVRRHRMKILSPVLTLANFSGKTEICDLEILSLISTTFQTWTAEECPLCKKGSKPYSARKDWAKLV